MVESFIESTCYHDPSFSAYLSIYTSVTGRMYTFMTVSGTYLMSTMIDSVDELYHKSWTRVQDEEVGIG